MRHPLRNFSLLAAIVLLQGCGGGSAVQDGATFAQEAPPATSLADKLKTLPGVVSATATPARGGRGGAGGAAPAGETVTLMFDQLIDHKNPSLGKFQQRVFVTNVDPAKPVILNTEGYQANGAGGTGELGRYLGAANVVTVEHRHFGQSIPKDASGATLWQYLTVKNAADDMHDIVSSLKKIYAGKWLATGASKGGQTSLFYKSYYPDDVAATVAYVAPMNIGQEDPRINIFINSVGDAETRKKIKDFQIAMFKREDEMIPLLNVNPAQYSMGVAKAYEYGVLEYPYAFWQYGTKPNTIPAPDAPAADMIAHYKQVNTMQYYGDATMKRFEAFIYEAFSEIGYYNYDVTDFKPYMHAFTFKNGDEPTNLDIAPAGTKDKIHYDPAAMAFVFNFLQYKANNVIFIYGETDAWSSTQMQLLGRTNAVKIVVENASHSARIGAASPEQRKQVLDALEQWMDVKVNRQ
ncbi:MAG TPA: S28 family serine protease [Phycisphaerae bacterium]|nr:S28 family serine protease [Phycisphaerae bacterium]